MLEPRLCADVSGLSGTGTGSSWSSTFLPHRCVHLLPPTHSASDQLEARTQQRREHVTIKQKATMIKDIKKKNKEEEAGDAWRGGALRGAEAQTSLRIWNYLQIQWLLQSGDVTTDRSAGSDRCVKGLTFSRNQWALSWEPQTGSHTCVQWKHIKHVETFRNVQTCWTCGSNPQSDVEPRLCWGFRTNNHLMRWENIMLLI